jgi:glycosyltransferase involved in cell wall biosynthesis
VPPLNQNLGQGTDHPHNEPSRPPVASVIASRPGTSEVSALLLQASNAGVAHYRLESWARAAKRNRAGHLLLPWWDVALTETHPWEVDILDPGLRNRILGELDSHIKKADVIVAQMCHTPMALELLMGVKVMYPHIPLVSEIDDNIISTPVYNPADVVYRPGSMFRAIAIEQFRMSDAMFVSTQNLKETYSEFCDHIYVMPNSLDFRHWDNLKHRQNKDLVRIGWMGGASHSEDLRVIEPVIKRILAKHKNVRFCFVHGIPDFLRGIDNVETVSQFTRIDRYPQFLASRAFDIGLAPLVDNAFNRGKSNLRWLEYSGLKVPCVASNVGHFKETLNHGQDVLLCDSEDEWVSSLSSLIADPNYRRHLGKAANKRARRDFNIDVNITNYVKALNEVRGRGQVRKFQEVA